MVTALAGTGSTAARPPVSRRRPAAAARPPVSRRRSAATPVTAAATGPAIPGARHR